MTMETTIGDGDTVAEIASPFSEGVVIERVGATGVCVKFPRNGPGTATVLPLDSVRLVRKAVVFPAYARVALLGHRDLGLCRVTQERVGEATMLRCESLDAVTWAAPPQFALTEAPDGEAEMARERAHRAERTARLATERAALLARRAGAPVTIIEGDGEVGVLADEALLNVREVQEADDEIAAALLSWFGDKSQGVLWCGVTADTVERALRAVGFSVFTRRPPLTPTELDENIPF